MLDVQRFLEIVVFSWITGNSDMHCKNFSLISKDGSNYHLAPAYDLLAVLLTGIKDRDELALPLTGVGVQDDKPIAGFCRASFVAAMVESGINEKIANGIINKFSLCTNKWTAVIDASFLPAGLKMEYKQLIQERMHRLAI